MGEIMQHTCLQAKYINDRDVLLSAAVAAGLPEAGAAAVIDDPTAVLDEVCGGHRHLPSQLFSALHSHW